MSGAEGMVGGSSDLLPGTPALFDLDGTLIATRRLYLEAFADALEPVLGERPTHEAMMALRPRAEVRFLLEVGGEAAHPGVMARFYEAYHRRHPHDFEGIYPGVPALLAKLREEGIPLGLVTGKSRRAWEITRPHVEPALGPFQVQVFDDDVPASKPDPAGIRKAVAALGAGAALRAGAGTGAGAGVGTASGRGQPRAVYVGDTRSDLEAARGAGLVPVAVLWSKREHERGPFAAAARALGGWSVRTPDELLGRLLPRAGTLSGSAPSA
jgi:pyrophosphatase PpaX